MVPALINPPKKMNKTCLPLVIAACGMIVSAAPLQDRITNEAQFYRQAVGEGLNSRPTIISDGTHWTLIPPGAILFIPEEQTAKVNARPVGKILNWTDFLALNSDWIGGEELSLGQAEGLEAILGDRASSWSSAGRIIVAVHQGSPIRVIAPLVETARN